MFSKGNYKEEGYEIKIGEPFFAKDGTEYVVDVFSPNGEEAAYFRLCHWFNHPVHGEILHIMEAEVYTAHRRKGIATAVYSLMEEHTGVFVHQESDQQSDEAKALWTQPGRAFGKK